MCNAICNVYSHSLNVVVSYQVSDFCGGELSHSLALGVLDEVDEEVDRGVEGGQKVAEAGHERQPGWPDQLGLSCKIINLNSVYILCLTPSSPTWRSSQMLGIHFTAWQQINTGR